MQHSAVVIRGQARAHGDVPVFVKRLATGPYIADVTLSRSAQAPSEALHMPFVEFDVTGRLVVAGRRP